MRLEECLKEYIEKKHRDLGIFQYGFITTDRIPVMEEVRKLCEMNSCGLYGSSWACPPGVGSLDECRKIIDAYKHAFVFTTKHDLEDSFDWEGMMEAKERHVVICDNVHRYVRSLSDEKILALSAEGCKRCTKCTYPDAPCRFPEKLTPSIEALGVQVSLLAKRIGVNYINGADTVTYFSCILFSEV